MNIKVRDEETIAKAMLVLIEAALNPMIDQNNIMDLCLEIIHSSRKTLQKIQTKGEDNGNL